MTSRLPASGIRVQVTIAGWLFAASYHLAARVGVALLGSAHSDWFVIRAMAAAGTSTLSITAICPIVAGFAVAGSATHPQYLRKRCWALSPAGDAAIVVRHQVDPLEQ